MSSRTSAARRDPGSGWLASKVPSSLRSSE